jgi:hypothetical protein
MVIVTPWSLWGMTFGPSGTASVFTTGTCTATMTEPLIRACTRDGRPPRDVQDGNCDAVYMYSVPCKDGHFTIDSGTTGIWDYTWTTATPFDTAEADTVLYATRGSLLSPTLWAPLVIGDPVRVGETVSITVPIQKPGSLGAFIYGTKVINQSRCASIEVGDVDDKLPLSVEVTGLVPCSYTAIISITANLK